MRKMYSSLKAEVASIDRKRKRLKKKRGLFLFFLDLFIKKASEFYFCETFSSFFLFLKESNSKKKEILANCDH